MFKTTVKWATLEDMINVAEFVAERKQKIEQLKNQAVTDGVVTLDKDAFTGSINFNSKVNADAWIEYIQKLADKYNKNIINTSVVEV